MILWDFEVVPRHGTVILYLSFSIQNDAFVFILHLVLQCYVNHVLLL